MKIEKISLDKIIPYINNAKEHPQEQISQIKASIKEFGFNDPIAIDENNVIIEGHGRFIALQQLGYKEVYIIRLNHLDDIQKKQYILAHNKLTINSGFDEDILKLELESISIEDYDLELTGFDISEVENFLRNNEGIEDIEEITEINENFNLQIKCENIKEFKELCQKLNVDVDETKQILKIKYGDIKL